MRIVIGEVEETDGNYKMARAIHMELSDADFELEPDDFIERFIRPAIAQLVAWHDEEAVRH
jgi:hypothetical protein